MDMRNTARKFCETSKVIGFLWLVMMSVSTYAETTQVHFTFQNEEGVPVSIVSAELLLTGWGISERSALPFTKDRLTIVFEKEWLTPYWPHRVVDLSEARILVHAPGYAALLSEPFVWIHDAEQLPNFSPNYQTNIAFPGNDARIIQQGQTIVYPVTFYAPQTRTIILRDDTGTTLPNMHVAVYLFWSRKNHCGVAYEDLPIGTFTTDTRGRMTISNAGKGLYYLDIRSDEAVYCLKDATRRDAYCAQATLPLSESETTIILHELHQMTFELVLLPPEVAKEDSFGLYTQIQTPCGWGGGRVGIFQASETLSVHCYPEQVEQMWIQREQEGNSSYSPDWIVDIEGIQNEQTYLIDLRNVERGTHVTPQVFHEHE